MLVTALRSPTIFARLSVEEADAIARFLTNPNTDSPHAVVAAAFRDQLRQGVIEASTRSAR